MQSTLSILYLLFKSITKIHHQLSVYTVRYLEYTVTILQCTLVFVEYTVQSVSAHQIYTYSERTFSLYTENILSTLLNSLIRYCSVHWSMWITPSSLDLFTKSINVLIVLYHCTLKDIFSTLLNSLIRYSRLITVLGW